MAERVERALIRTKNSSAPGPDGAGYRLIKVVKDTPLGQGLYEEIAISLLERLTPRRWKEMRVVLIPKPGRDLMKMKSWRPITLINCVVKIGEKLVADAL